MAEPALLDPSPFDLRHYPAHLFDPDLLRSPDRGGEGDDSGEGSAAGSDPAVSTSASPVTSAANSVVASAGNREVKHEDSDEGRSGAAPNRSLKRKQASAGASSDGAKCRRSGDGELSPSPRRWIRAPAPPRAPPAPPPPDPPPWMRRGGAARRLRRRGGGGAGQRRRGGGAPQALVFL